jgi:hypothetical protein
LNNVEHTSYSMKVKSAGNGHVHVKTMLKARDREWRTDIKQYDRGKPALGQESDKAVEQDMNKKAVLNDDKRNFEPTNTPSKIDTSNNPVSKKESETIFDQMQK